jgi:rare lipoprotein A
MVKVTNTKNGQSVQVRINDRGPFKRGRIIDLTPAAAQKLGFDGLATVTLSSL